MDSMNKYGMLGHHNQMTVLLNRIERFFGLRNFPLPDGLKKDDWPTIISEDSIPVFSNYFPYMITDIVTPDMEKDGYFFIDQHVPEGSRILGVVDVDWQAFRSDSRYDRNFGISMVALDYIAQDHTLSDSMVQIVGTDMLSLFNLGIYIEFVPPNKIRLVTVNGSRVNKYRPFPIKILLEHPSIMTISPTMMGSFENLVKCDVSTAIYEELKFYDDQDTVYGSFRLQLDKLQDWANRRDDVIRTLDEAHLSTANENMPLIMTV